MKRLKQLNNRILIALSLIAVLVAGSMSMVFAVEGVSMPDLTSDSSTLTVQANYTDEKESTPIKGMELTIYKVADVSVSNGNVKYSSTEEFKPVDVDYNNLTTGSSIDAAADLLDFVVEQKMEGKKAETGENGKAYFGQVSNGMYLVANTGATDDAKEYTRLNPYIVMAPQPMTDIGVNDWEYDVVSIPKTETGKFVTYGKPDFKLTKTSNVRRATYGDRVPYIITIENIGSADAIGVKAVDELPKGLDYISDDHKGKADGNIVTWTVDIKVGEKIVINLLAEINNEAEVGSIINTVLIEGVEGVYEPVSDDASIVLEEYKPEEEVEAAEKPDEKEAEVKAAEKSTKTAKTGDNSKLMVFIVTLVVVGAVLIIMRRRRNKDRS